MMNKELKVLAPEQSEELLQVLSKRFEANMNRHPELAWAMGSGPSEAGGAAR